MWISPNTDFQSFQLDELFWFVKFKPHTQTHENIYITLMISANPRQIVGYAVEYSKTETVFQRVVDSAPAAEVYHTDGNVTYLAVIFPGRHNRNAFDKSDTHDVESVNADLRTYIAGLRRRSRCFFRSIETIQAVMSVFVNAYNKFGHMKQKCAVAVKHRNDPTGRHLHKTRDFMQVPKDFL
ncbi:MAG: hypothetical protein LBQ27_01920 [Clostridiales bacterium]|nr:hypothetical protein [Clostridiales bacterium]